MNKKALLEQKEITQNELNVYIRKLENGSPLNTEEMTTAKLLKEKMVSINEKLENLNKNDNKGVDDNMSTKRNYNNDEIKLEESLRALNIPGNKVIVPQTISDRIITMVHELIDFNQCDLYQVAGTVVVPVDNSAMTMEAITEGTPIADHTGDFTSVKLEAQPYGKLVKIGRSLLANAGFDVLAHFENRLAQAIACTIDKKVVEAVMSGTNLENAKAANYTYDELIGIMAKMNKVDAVNAKWIMSREDFVKVVQLKDAAGNQLLTNGVVNGVVTYTLCGKEVQVSENAVAGQIAFANLKGIALKLSPEIGIEQLVEFRSSFQECLMGSLEIDAKVCDNSKIFILKAGA